MYEISKIQFGNNELKQYSLEYNIIECKCSFNRTFDCCLPHADVKCEQIEVSVVAPGMNDLNLVEWFINNSEQSGRILLELADNIDNSEDFAHEILFEDAYCASLCENYDIETKSRRIMTLVIVPLNVTVFDVNFPRPE
ncbi:MAG: hypothetical protein MJ002_03140 [Paludibacteraceae bacterium]|nr:hypothetical protein [Paludibacteraceae bacterium]